MRKGNKERKKNNEDMELKIKNLLFLSALGI